MNKYDLAALHAITAYHKQHGQYPACIEATASHGEKMRSMFFSCVESNNLVQVPVVPLGTCDIVFRHLLVKNLGNTYEQAACATAEEFQRIGAKLARAGMLIMEPKETWGLDVPNSRYFFSQIEVWVFGEQAAFNVAMAEEHNLPGD